MRILIIDNNVMPEYWGAADLRRALAGDPSITLSVRRGPSDDLPDTVAGFDKIVISGSKTSALDSAPWIDHLHRLVREAIERRTPTLGVCYGHQTIARALGGIEAVRRAKTAEFGWTRIQVHEGGTLLSDLGGEFYSFSSHFDEVSRLPAGFRRLASSEGCDLQAFELAGAPIFGIQFHPEKSIEDGEKILAECRKRGEPDSLLNPESGKKLYDPEVARKIFSRFLKL